MRQDRAAVGPQGGIQFGDDRLVVEPAIEQQCSLLVGGGALGVIVALGKFTLLNDHSLDVRMSIGIGDKTYDAARISESNGSAFVRSGELFEQLKKQKNTLAINTGQSDFDKEINLMLRLAQTFMNSWLVQSAEFILTEMENPTLSQEEIGLKLNINQAAVSRRRKRSQFELILELENYYRQKIKTLTL